MPTISMFFGILIKMYFNEHNPPHFHAYYQGFEAVFDIRSGKFGIKWSRRSHYLKFQELINEKNIKSKCLRFCFRVLNG